MNDPRLPRFVYFLLLILGLLNWVRIYPQIPARMASHFDAYGAPNGWAPKEMFFVLMFLVVALTAIPTFMVHRLINPDRPDRVNLPNKSYWLAPEHFPELQRFFSAQMAWFGCGVLFVLLFGTTQAINANLPGGHFDSTAMFHVIVAFVLLTILWTILLIRHFSRVPPSSSTS
jgi:uncharacterized membrane protein